MVLYEICSNSCLRVQMTPAGGGGGGSGLNYGYWKILKKSSSQEPLGSDARHLVCSIV